VAAEKRVRQQQHHGGSSNITAATATG